MNAEDRWSRLLLVSPWPLFLFLLLPLTVVLSLKLAIPIPLALSARALLANNVVFALFACLRLFRYLFGLKSKIRYGASRGRPSRSRLHPSTLSQTRDALARGGYAFSADQRYAEKPDRGYLGTTLIYAGLFLLLSVGSWDNLVQFSGVVLDGMGPATDLNKVESYRSISAGPLVRKLSSLPRMQIANQYLPDATFPKGGTDIVLSGADGKERAYTLKPTEPVAWEGYDIYMTKLVFEPEIVIRRPDGKPLFDAIVPLNPLVQRRGPFSFYGLFQGYNIEGGVYYRPETSSLLLVVSRNAKKVVSELTFQLDQQVTNGDFTISCAKMGQWSEIHVVHRRHKALLFFGGLVLLIGLVLRVAVRPERVWLEETPEGCRIWAAEGSADQLIEA